jgi:hypothetical protein
MHHRSLLPAAALTLALAACIQAPAQGGTSPAASATSAAVAVSKNAQEEPELKIDPADQTCRSNDDCVVKLTQCACDCGSPVNREHARKYEEALDRACKGYSGRMCKMAPCTDVATCDDGVCRIKK